MSDQDAGTTTPEAAATATEDTGNAVTGPQDAAETSSDDQDNGKGPKGGSDALKADLARERRERQKLQTELKKLQDRDLSELERAQKQASEATKRLEQLEAESMRQRAALRYGIPAEDIHRIQGDTEAELDADAAAFAKKYAKTAPKPDLSQGSRADRQGPVDMNQLIRSAARRG